MNGELETDSPTARASRLSARQLRKAALIAGLASPIIAVLARTYRWRVDGFQHYERIVASGRQPIFSFWHGRILPGMLFWRDRGILVMTSENFDGEWIARIIRRFGFGAARGSTSRGGRRALVQMKRALIAGEPVAFSLDGPRGPAQVAQPGAVWLAGATGSPLLPFHLEASRAWTVNSWDRTQVPKPYATVAVAIGPGIEVAGTSDATVEEQRAELERQLEALARHARKMLTERPH